MYDLIIIGGGIAGKTAAIYSTRKKLKTLIISQEIGGQTAKASEVENFPGFKKISGVELALAVKDQAVALGTEIKEGIEVSEIVTSDKEKFIAKTTKGNFEGKSVIIASGKKPRELKAPGEKEFLGKGVAYCATCDAPLFHNKTVIVVGGGNSALEAVFELRKYDNKVILVVRKDQVRADAIEIEKAEKDSDIKISYNTEVEKIEGDKFVTKVTLKNNKTKKSETIEAQGIFVEIGWEVATGFVPKDLKRNEFNEIIIDQKTGATNVAGIFAAGDVTDVKYKQAVIAAGSGAIAALSVNEYLNKNEKK